MDTAPTHTSGLTTRVNHSSSSIISRLIKEFRPSLLKKQQTWARRTKISQPEIYLKTFKRATSLHGLGMFKPCHLMKPRSTVLMFTTSQRFGHKLRSHLSKLESSLLTEIQRTSTPRLSSLPSLQLTSCQVSRLQTAKCSKEDSSTILIPTGIDLDPTTTKSLSTAHTEQEWGLPTTSVMVS